MSVIAVSDASFEREVLRSELPVLVDLKAEWCEPCKRLEPLLVALAQELQGRLKVVSIDVDQNPFVAQSLGAQSIPLLVLFKDGRVVNHHAGLLDAGALRRLVERVLPASKLEVAPKDLLERIRREKAFAVDLREEGSFLRYRIPGAVRLDVADLEKRLPELQRQRQGQPVLYSRTPEAAREAAEQLQTKGFSVAFLAGGFLGWEAEGLEVEKGN